jgi:hypothetical protein
MNGFMPPEDEVDLPPGGGYRGPGDGPGGSEFPPPNGMGQEMFSSQPINFRINIKLASDK